MLTKHLDTLAEVRREALVDGEVWRSLETQSLTTSHYQTETRAGNIAVLTTSTHPHTPV